MNKKTFFRILLLLIISGIGLFPWALSTPQVNAQAVLPTPTAQDDGRIIYIAQPGDSRWIISIKMDVSEEQLYQLNNADPDTPVIEGQNILIALVTATPVPTEMEATATPNILTPAVKGYGEICVVLFDDVNGNSTHDTDEAFLPDGAVSLVDRSGQVNQTGQTNTGPDPLCFSDLPEGDYNLSLAVPDGYNATTSMNAPLKLIAGDRSTLNFGAQSSSQAQPAAAPSGTGRNPVIAIIGAIFILGGIGVGIYFLRPKH